MLNAADIINIAVESETNDSVIDDRFDELFEYYTDPACPNAMPYGTAKARTGDPYNWIANELSKVLTRLHTGCNPQSSWEKAGMTRTQVVAARLGA